MLHLPIPPTLVELIGADCILDYKQQAKNGNSLAGDRLKNIMRQGRVL
ncbi:MAG TPA: hypothetical protein VK203_22755 [Nostocaceae cyanobacterium]|nr:hypothetical protein [Nostocaceae cyanobacterium]